MRLAQGRDIEAVDAHRPAVGTIDAADEIQQRGFSRAAATDDRHHFAIGKFSFRVLENPMLPLAFTKAATQILQRSAPTLLQLTSPFRDSRY